MKIISNDKDFRLEEPTVVALGKFDGRHLGHQKLMRTMQQVKKEKGYKTAIFSFLAPPVSLLSGIKQGVITTNEERRSKLRKTGIDYLIEYPISKKILAMEAEQFVARILVGKMNAKAIVIGTDGRFGYQRKGDAALLKQLAGEYGYQLLVIEKEKDDCREISSTYIREVLDQGDMEKAAALLGEPYYFYGKVVHGNHIGSAILGFPTANLVPPPEKYLPPYGVYVSRVLIGHELYPGVTNIGVKPTIETTGNLPAAGVETYVFDYHGDLYGKEIEVGLVHFIRPERKMKGLDELKIQIQKDKDAAADYLSRHSQWLKK